MRTLPALDNGGLFLADNVSDVDNNALQGVAITSVDGNGTWQYQLNGQETWQDVSEVSNTSALLGTTDLIRYVPDGENGETATFTYQAWDQTTGGAGTYADASAGGGTSAFSSATDTASLTVGDVNDAPVLTPTTPTLTGTDEDTTSTGQTVGSFLADNVSDVDNNALQGVAITSVDGNGTWQYQLNGQETWQDVSEVSNTSALLLVPLTDPLCAGWGERRDRHLYLSGLGSDHRRRWHLCRCECRRRHQCLQQRHRHRLTYCRRCQCRAGVDPDDANSDRHR